METSRLVGEDLVGWRGLVWMDNGYMNVRGTQQKRRGLSIPQWPGCTAPAAHQSWIWAGLAGTSSHCYWKIKEGSRPMLPHLLVHPTPNPYLSSPRPLNLLPLDPYLQHSLGEPRVLVWKTAGTPLLDGAVQRLGSVDELQRARRDVSLQPEPTPPPPLPQWLPSTNPAFH